MPRSLIGAYEARIAQDVLKRDSAQLAAVERLEAVSMALASGGERGIPGWPDAEAGPQGAYLWGAVGRGKSMLMELLLNTLKTRAKRRVHFHAFMQEIHRALHEARQGCADDPVSEAAARAAEGLDVLALDEMEITDIVDAMIVGRVFERLLGDGVAVLITSNRAPDDLYRDGLKRDLFLPFVRLLEERLDVVPLEGREDHRGRTPLAQEVYLTPADAEATAAMDATWRALAGGRGEPMDLGHGVTIATDGRGAARASFADLCERPLGAADYIRLAERASMLLLDAIPVLGERRPDEARRFITLIDVLYDTGTGLVASADAPPERLHPEGEGAEEFLRTASRLREMLSPDWPGRAALHARLSEDAA